MSLSKGWKLGSSQGKKKPEKGSSASHTGEMEDLRRQVCDLRVQVDAGNSVMAELSQQRERYANESEERGRRIREQESKIRSLDDDLRRQERVLGEQRQTIREKDSTIRDLREQLRAKETVVQKLNQQIWEKDAIISSLEDALSAKQKVFEEEIRKKNLTVEDYKEEVDMLQKRIKEITGEWEKAKGDLLRCTEELTKKQRELTSEKESRGAMERERDNARTLLYMQMRVINQAHREAQERLSKSHQREVGKIIEFYETKVSEMASSEQ